jgi:hypothetical protein
MPPRETAGSFHGGSGCSKVLLKVESEAETFFQWAFLFKVYVKISQDTQNIQVFRNTVLPFVFSLLQCSHFCQKGFSFDTAKVPEDVTCDVWAREMAIPGLA